MGAEGFHGRVRDGIGCISPRHDHQVIGASSQMPDVRDRMSEIGCQNGSGLASVLCSLICEVPRFCAWSWSRRLGRVVAPSWARVGLLVAACDGDQADGAISTG